MSLRLENNDPHLFKSVKSKYRNWADRKFADLFFLITSADVLHFHCNNIAGRPDMQFAMTINRLKL